MKKVLFIHRSVGQNLLDDGELVRAIQAKAAKKNVHIKFKDINNNVQKGIPGDDTKPSDYAEYFSKHNFSEDLVVIKSCYPNNAIKSEKELEILKKTYEKVADKYTNNSRGKLLILTTPPLRPFRTNKQEADRARKLANWLKKDLPSKRVSVFDFYNSLAASENSKHANMLKKEYRRLFPWDNHPNRVASKTITPALASVIVSE